MKTAGRGRAGSAASTAVVESSVGDPLAASLVSERVQEIVGEGFSVEKFVENFEVIAEATGGVKALRRLILDLAIRGLLSQAKLGDEDAGILFRSANIDREERQRTGTARQMGELSTVETGEAPFGLKTGWVWTRIGLAVNLVNGRAFKPSDWSPAGLPIVRIQNLNDPTAPFNHCGFDVEPKHILRPGDFLISWSGTPGTSFGAFIWNGPKGVLNQHIFRAEIYANAYEYGFLRIAINARLDEMIAQAHGAVGLQHITKGKLEALPIPLPPLAEQKRIVAKVDQLTALCDDLEARQTKKRDTSTRLTKSALEALTTAEGPDEFDAAWKRVVENFDVLIDRAEKLTELRRAITGLALRGTLVAPGERTQDASSGDPEENACGRHALPNGWRWLPLRKLISWGPKNGYSPKGVEYETSVRALTLTATTSGRFDGQFFKYIDEDIPEDSELWLQDGDLLVQRGNTIDFVGVAAVYRGPSNRFIYPDLMMKMRVAPEFDLAFVHMALNGPEARRFIVSRASGTSGSMPKINQATLLEVPIPTPPLEEQQRIVLRVQSLLQKCDQLDELFRASERRAAKFVSAATQRLAAP